ncbi:HAUS augmin-like complex subunit 8 [Megalops cyprinoides]|uniref:HAUS augmin-like complex subunit 8 n=1 Tax=Megalops cyprinoides TaxID=118141 RepID=UPI001864D08F|nr:HAUS augmin-like complex subunit 8 [Megalops cyprinoides]
MASRRLTTVHRLQKPLLGDSNNSEDGSQNNSGNNSGTRKKTKPAGKVVQSRYLQAQPADKRSQPKTHSASESTYLAPRPASPKAESGRKQPLTASPRRSVACQSALNRISLTSSILEPSMLGGNVLQSTILDGHCVRPEFDVSAIKEKTATLNTVEAGNEKEILENQTFLLAYLTAKMECNTRKLIAEAEHNLLLVMEEEERLRKKVHEKKRQHLLLEKHKQLNDLLDLQSTALAPVSAAAKQFTQEYKTFATAVDTTRHELPVKNFHIEGDRREFLDKAEACLKESEAVLRGCVRGACHESDRALELLGEMQRESRELHEQLTGGFSELLELSSLVSRQTVQIHQSLEEERIGAPLAQALYLPKQ